MNTASFQPLLCRRPGCSKIAAYIVESVSAARSIDFYLEDVVCPDCFEDMKAKEEIQAAENHVISDPDPFGLITNPLGQRCPSDIDPTPPGDDWYYR